MIVSVADGISEMIRCGAPSRAAGSPPAQEERTSERLTTQRVRPDVLIDWHAGFCPSGPGPVPSLAARESLATDNLIEGSSGYAAVNLKTLPALYPVSMFLRVHPPMENGKVDWSKVHS